MRILLAGGGTAGHTSPLLATADALRRLDPAVEITCLGTPRGLENRVVPEAGYPLELIPPVPLPRTPNADLLRVPARLRGAVQGDRTTSSTGCGPTWSSATAATSRCRRTSPPAAQAAARRPRAERAARAGQQGRRPGRRPGRGELPGHPAAQGGVRRPADPPDDLRARPGRAARRGAGVLRARPRPADAGRHRRLAGRPPAQPVASSGAAEPLGDAGVQVLHVVGPHGSAAPGRPACPYVVESLRRPDGPRPRRRRPDGLPGRRHQRHRGGRGRLPAIFVPLPIGNGEQEHNARPVVDAGGALLVDDADVHRRLGGRDRARRWPRTRPAGRDGRGRVRPDPARRRRQAGPDRARDRRGAG